MKAIFYPVAALVTLTFAVGVRVYFARAGATKARRVQIGDFRVGESPSAPADVALPNRNYVIHRLGAFAASNVVLLLLWMRLVAAL